MNQILKIAELFSAVMDREFGPLEKDGLVGININYGGDISVHVTDQYYDENFGDYLSKEVDQPRHGNVRHSFKTEFGEIFCLKKAKFGRVG